MEGSDLGGQGAEGHHGASLLEGDLLDPSGLQAAEGRMDQSLDVGGRGVRQGVIAFQEVGAQDSRASVLQDAGTGARSDRAGRCPCEGRTR